MSADGPATGGDGSAGRAMIGEEPGPPALAGVAGLHDPLAYDGQDNVVTQAPAGSADGIGDHHCRLIPHWSAAVVQIGRVRESFRPNPHPPGPILPVIMRDREDGARP